VEIKLKTLTPLWTGGAAGKCDRIHTTGIMGSLRWWYEALVRGFGGYACDPGSGGCTYDSKKGQSSICLACQLFGCTGYARRFRLVVEGGGDGGRLKEVRLKNPGTKKHLGWRIPSKLAGHITLNLDPMQPSGLDIYDKASIYYTIRLIERYGALGAKTSHGQGVVKVIDWSGLPIEMEADAWTKAMKSRPANDETNSQPPPNMGDFIGGTATLDDSVTSKPEWWSPIPLNGLGQFFHGTSPSWIASAPAVRVHLRSWLRFSQNFPDFTGNLISNRHRLMGSIQDPVNPKGSDIFVTHLYKDNDQWHMRVFGNIPRNGTAVDQGLRNLLKDKKRLGSEIKSALGGIPVSVDLYPADIVSLFSERKGGTHE